MLLLSVYRPLILILHILGVVLGLGGAIISDIFFFKFLRDFLISFLTPLELQRLYTRILVSTELLQGRSVSAIREKLSVGYTTIRPVDILLSRLLPGYRASLPTLLSHPERSRKRGLERLKDRSPLLAALAATVQR